MAARDPNISPSPLLPSPLSLFPSLSTLSSFPSILYRSSTFNVCPSSFPSFSFYQPFSHSLFHTFTSLSHLPFFITLFFSSFYSFFYFLFLLFSTRFSLLSLPAFIISSPLLLFFSFSTCFSLLSLPFFINSLLLFLSFSACFPFLSRPFFYHFSYSFLFQLSLSFFSLSLLPLHFLSFLFLIMRCLSSLPFFIDLIPFSSSTFFFPFFPSLHIQPPPRFFFYVFAYRTSGGPKPVTSQAISFRVKPCSVSSLTQ